VLGRQLVAPVGAEQQDPLLAEVVRQEGDQVEGGAVRPMQVLHDQDHRRGGRDCTQQLAHVLAGQQRAQRLHDRQVGHLRTDQVDAPSHQRQRSRGTCPDAQLRHQPRLTDARIAGQQDRVTLSRHDLPHPLLEPLQLAQAADEGGVRPSCHRTSMPAPSRTRKAADKAPGRRDTTPRPPR
jgi:hypothetical protein